METKGQPRSPERVTLTDMAFGGEAIGRLDGRVVFVPYGLPGEEVLVEMVEDRRDFARGRIVEVLEPSPARVQPPCPYYGECGGCSLQHADYEAQLQLKRKVVIEQLRRIGRFGEAADIVLSSIGMVRPWEYRNHARFTVGRRFGELCFTRRGTRQLMRIDCCPIMQSAINGVVAQVQGRLLGFKGHQVAIRHGANTGDLHVNPPIGSLQLGAKEHGLEEELFGRRFRIASPSFFQVNTRREPRPVPAEFAPAAWPVPAEGLSMAEILMLSVNDRLRPAHGGLLVDAYSGVGTFSVLLAPSFGSVIGIEESAAAVKDARHNAADLDNVEFVHGKAEHVLSELRERPAAVVLDPARVGCHPAVLAALGDLEVPRVVYVSCDPATMSRDLAALADGGYCLENVQPVDMFPQTYHIECVAALRR